ncbi:MAG: hypothetical protein LBJ63_07660 [Prevotellaceae bacterium]|jgi:uncharacterized membrane protein|nr:hypothetical protein [Prevotellaceae bacterium]
MEIKELTKQQKLNVLNSILENLPNGDYFLCIKISLAAFYMDYITDEEYYFNDCSDITASLIPELLQFKPKSKYENMRWFKNGEERLEALKKLIKIIEEQ